MDNAKQTSGAPAEAGKAVSRPELERLQAARREPAAQRALTPDGMQQIGNTLDQQREAKIRDIETRLGAAKDRAVIDFWLGQTRSKAKEGFDRSR